MNYGVPTYSAQPFGTPTRFGPRQQMPMPTMYGAPQAYGAAQPVRPTYSPPATVTRPPTYGGGHSINDPTLAAGASVPTYGGGSGITGSLDPGMGFNGGNGTPNSMWAKGWRSRRGPDGRMYWVPPGTPEQFPTYGNFNV